MKVLLVCPRLEMEQHKTVLEDLHLLDLFLGRREGSRVAGVFWQWLLTGKASFVCLLNPIIVAAPLRVTLWSLEGPGGVK